MRFRSELDFPLIYLKSGCQHHLSQRQWGAVPEAPEGILAKMAIYPLEESSNHLANRVIVVQNGMSLAQLSPV